MSVRGCACVWVYECVYACESACMCLCLWTWVYSICTSAHEHAFMWLYEGMLAFCFSCALICASLIVNIIIVVVIVIICYFLIIKNASPLTLLLFAWCTRLRVLAVQWNSSLNFLLNKNSDNDNNCCTSVVIIFKIFTFLGLIKLLVYVCLSSSIGSLRCAVHVRYKFLLFVRMWINYYFKS